MRKHDGETVIWSYGGPKPIKLTPAMERALRLCIRMKDRYDESLSNPVSSLMALERRGLVEHDKSARWRAFVPTDAGRAWLDAHESEGKP